jgi:hypothetical protein
MAGKTKETCMSNVARLRGDDAIRLIAMDQIAGHDPLTRTADYPGSTQIRAAHDPALAERYAALLIEGVKFPPIVVVEQEDAAAPLLLADGHHRVEAQWIAHTADPARFQPMIWAEVHQGDFKLVIKLAIEANRGHGQPLSDADLAHAFRVACEAEVIKAIDVEATRNLLGCSLRSAERLTELARENYKRDRDALIVALSISGKKQRAIAEQVGCSLGTVAAVLAVQKPPVAETEQPETELPLDDPEPEEEPKAPDPGLAAKKWREQVAAQRKQIADRIAPSKEAPKSIEGVWPLPEPPPMPFVRPPAGEDAMLAVRETLESIDHLPDAEATLAEFGQYDGDEEIAAAIAARLDRSIAWMAAFNQAWQAKGKVS